MSLGDARRAGAPRGRDGLFGGADLDAPQSPQRGDGAAECAASDAAAAVRPQWPLRRDGLSPALQLAFRPFRPRPRPRVRGRAFEAWDFEAVATVVYLCCSAFAHGTDVFEKAADVADAFWEEQVCGRGLAEMLRRDASYGFILLAGVLPRPGSRANVVGSLRAYVSAHGREDWPVSSEAGAILLSFPLSVSLLKFEDRDDEVHASASLDRFKAVTCPGGFGDLVSTTYLLANAAFKKGKSETSATMPMPLFVTLLINELKEELGNADKVVMVGTLVIRSMFDTDTLVGVDGKQSPRPLLKVNESEVTGEQLRMLSSKMEEMVDSHVYARTTTYSLEVPTTRRNVFARAPFNITSFEFSLDFQPLLARLPNGKFIKFVPDLLCPIGDLRELVSVEPERLDEIHKFDLINPNPSVEVELVSEAERITHAPSMKITFFGDTDAVRALLNIIIPIIFIAFGNVLNVLYCEDYDNFLANALTLGLTLVFFIPTLNQIESGSNEMDLNQLLVVLLFLGLVFGCMDCKRCNGEDAAPLGIPNRSRAPFWNPERKRRDDSPLNPDINKRFQGPEPPWRAEPDDRSFSCGPQAVKIPHTIPYNDAWEQEYNKAWEAQDGRATLSEAAEAQLFEPLSIKARLQRARYLEDAKAAVSSLVTSLVPAAPFYRLQAFAQLLRKPFKAVLRKPFHAPKVEVDAAGADDYFVIGDAVEVYDTSHGNGFNDGLVVAFGKNGTYSVLYDGGDYETKVKEYRIRKVGTTANDLAVGDAVEARYRSGSKFYPGEIASRNGDGTYSVDYDDDIDDAEVAGKTEFCVLRRLINKTTGAPAAPAAAPGPDDDEFTAL